MFSSKRILPVICLACSLLSLSLVAGEPGEDSDKDWPQWRGPHGNGISMETGLIKSFPESGPNALWRVSVGSGFSGISVSGGKLFTMYANGGEEFAFCYDAASGEELWSFKSDSAFKSQFGHGPRATPAVDDKRVYTVGGNGMLYALNLENGQKVWQHNLVSEFGAKIPGHGISSSPLIEGDLLLVNVGGNEGNAFIAFNKKDGKVAWRTHTDSPGYSTPVGVTVDGIRQIVFFSGKAAVSISPKDGSVFWEFPWETSYDVNAATPVFIPKNKVLISSGYGKGAALLEIKTIEGKPAAGELWSSKVMRNHFASSVFYEGHLYGFDENKLKCIDPFTQETKWVKRGFKKGSFIIADGQLIVLGERGKLGLIEATPDEYRENSVVKILKGRCWTVPTLANGILYLRNQKEMVAINMKVQGEI